MIMHDMCRCECDTIKYNKAMKKGIIFLTAVVAMVVFGCTEKAYIDAPGVNTHNTDSIPIQMPDTDGIVISVDEAIALCKEMDADVKTTEVYKISGVITKNTTNPLNVPSKYQNINFNLSDNGGQTSIACYYMNNLRNRAFHNNSEVPRVGSKVTVCGVLTNYKGTTPEITSGFIVRVDSMVAPPPFPGCPDPEEGETSVTDAVNIAVQLADKSESRKIYKIKGVVTEIMSIDTGNFGNAEWIISDGTSFFYVYRGKGLNGKNFTKAEQLQVNDTMTIQTKLYNYGGIAETKANAAYIIKTTNKNW